VRRLLSVLPQLVSCSIAGLCANNIRPVCAGTFIGAIERHQDESAEEAARFRRLSHADKKLLLQFLGSL
jgi:hypothetical protein